MKNTDDTANVLSVNMHNTMNSREFAEFIKVQTQSLLADPSIAHVLPPTMCWGSPGCGKSSIVKQVADELGIDFIDVRLAQMEPCDIRGLPVANNADKTMEWYVNGVWPRGKNSKGILFLDELSACDRSIAVAAYELILDRRLGRLYSVPDGWYIVAAGNLVTDRAVANTMSSALANRFLHVELQADATEWTQWAAVHGLHPSVTGYIQYKPNSLFSMENENLERGWPSPRSWERVSQMTKLHEQNEELLRKVVYGLVGTAKGIEFMEFHRLNKKFDNALDMMYGRIPISIPGKNDEKYALASNIVYHVWRGEDDADTKVRVSGFMKIIMKFSPDFAAMALSNAIAGSDVVDRARACKYIFNNSDYKDWAKKHSTLMMKYLRK